jgi:hypothetical protein
MDIRDVDGAVQEGLHLFSTEENRNEPAVVRLVKGVSRHMSIHAPRDLKAAIYDMTRAMVNSDKVFKHTNLATLLFFLHDVGPDLGGTAGTDRSSQLTNLMTALWKNPAEQTRQQHRDIEACLRNHGRPIATPAAYNYWSEQAVQDDDDDLYSSV